MLVFLYKKRVCKKSFLKDQRCRKQRQWSYLYVLPYLLTFVQHCQLFVFVKNSIRTLRVSFAVGSNSRVSYYWFKSHHHICKKKWRFWKYHLDDPNLKYLLFWISCRNHNPADFRHVESKMKSQLGSLLYIIYFPQSVQKRPQTKCLLLSYFMILLSLSCLKSTIDGNTMEIAIHITFR